MPTIYRRHTWPVRVALDRRGNTLVRYGTGRFRGVLRLGSLDRTHLLPVRSALSAWTESLPRMRGARDEVHLVRIAVQASTPQLHALPWESLLGDGSVVVVRESSVHSRVAPYPLTLPIRVMEIGVQGRSPARSVLDNLGRDELAVHDTFAVRRYRRAPDRKGDLPGDHWPNAAIIHLAFVAARTELVLSTGSPEIVNTLGWLDRLAGAWGTHLIILECGSDTDVTAACLQAAALLDRGGPAVLVCMRGNRARVARFLRAVIDDVPLDAALPTLGQVQSSLFVGMGREDDLRLTPIVAGLLRIHESLSATTRRRWSLRGAHVALAPSLGGGLRSMSLRTRRSPSRTRRAVMATIEQTYNATAWDMTTTVSRPLGLLDVGEGLQTTRSVARVRQAATPTEIEADGERVVNGRLCTRNRSTLNRIPQDASALVTGRPYHLQIDVGPRDRTIRTYGIVGLIEEVFAWEPGGAWVEVGVTGLDFDVVGDPVQEMWVPRRGSGQALVFTVIPRRRGLSVLRFCLYVNQMVVQSFRLAALTSGRPAEDGRPVEIGVALDIPHDAAVGATWMSRLEYSVEEDPVAATDWPARALSIVANDLDDRPVITLKAKGEFAVQVDSSIPDRVQRLRDVMRRGGLIPVEGVDETKWSYAYAAQDGSNRGTPAQFARTLTELALAGFELFDRIVPRPVRPGLRQALAENDQTIHVAQVVLDSVIPWAALYDRTYRPTKSNNVAQGVCTAALPDSEGVLPIGPCGARSECLLHPEVRSPDGLPYAPDTVVCPRAFWGFRHRIELPAHQVAPDGTSLPLVQSVAADESVRMAAGVHAGLELHAEHIEKLRALPTPRSLTVLGPDYTTDEVVTRLTDLALDIVYFYCHADGGRGTDVAPPRLLFRARGGSSDERCLATDLDAEEGWDHHPLVIVNGCKTAGFRPDALSDFIVKFVRDRSASGVLATEIIVWERLATEMAETFLRRFLNGASAGEALAVARRRLFNQLNPLGLAYTWYGSAELSLGAAPGPDLTRPQ
jgi:CHAT domain-containing protein